MQQQMMQNKAKTDGGNISEIQSNPQQRKLNQQLKPIDDRHKAKSSNRCEQRLTAEEKAKAKEDRKSKGRSQRNSNEQRTTK